MSFLKKAHLILLAAAGATLPSRSTGDERDCSGARLRNEARLILREHCGSCHHSDVKDAPPAALRVYDLREDNWPAQMTVEQLPKLNGRMKTKGTVGQRSKIAQFVESELSSRHRAQP